MGSQDAARGIRKLMGLLKDAMAEEVPKIWTHYAECLDCENIRYFEGGNIPDSLGICPCPGCGQFAIIQEVDTPDEEEQEETEEQTEISPDLVEYLHQRILGSQYPEIGENGKVTWKTRMPPGASPTDGYKGEYRTEEHVKRLYTAKQERKRRRDQLDRFPEDEVIVLAAMIRNLYEKLFEIDAPPFHDPYARASLSAVIEWIKDALDDFERHNTRKLVEAQDD